LDLAALFEVYIVQVHCTVQRELVKYKLQYTASAPGSSGYYELKEYKPWSDGTFSKSLAQMQ